MKHITKYPHISILICISALLSASAPANTDTDYGSYNGMVIWILSFTVILLVCIIARLAMNIKSDKAGMLKVKGKNKQLLQKLSELENEIENLKSALSENIIDNRIKETISRRIRTLNEIVCRHIESNDNDDLNTIVDNLIADRSDFMKSTMLAVKAAYPDFINYLQSKDLTDYEIQYASLYAVGMNGKSIGKYLNDRRHYHTSSDIRKKLGLTEHDTNLAIHIRRLINR